VAIAGLEVQEFRFSPSSLYLTVIGSCPIGLQLDVGQVLGYSSSFF